MHAQCAAAQYALDPRLRLRASSAHPQRTIKADRLMDWGCGLHDLALRCHSGLKTIDAEVIVADACEDVTDIPTV